jgi:hypothetical protein
MADAEPEATAEAPDGEAADAGAPAEDAGDEDGEEVT